MVAVMSLEVRMRATCKDRLKGAADGLRCSDGAGLSGRKKDQRAGAARLGNLGDEGEVGW